MSFVAWHCPALPELIVMDTPSRVLAQGVPPDVPLSYRALADHSEVPCSTLHHRAHGRRSMEEKTQSQQYLTAWEEEALVKFHPHMSDLGHPVRIKFISLLVYRLTPQRPQSQLSQLSASAAMAVFSACGLFPLNLDRVLRGIPKPIAELTVNEANKVDVAPITQDTVRSPLTPVAPVTTQGLVSLQNIIVDQDAQAIDKRSKFSRQRHLQKAEVLGRAKVMGFNELEEARAKRAEKEATKEAKVKAKRGRKRKASEEVEATASNARRKRKGTPDAEELKAKVARQSEVQVEEDKLGPTWRTAEAPMLHN
ncbi:hypothetical protein CC78DRAFT_616558 [Lojkania enalia]|uniref:Uncharacterized protein n=1 Tax=Lojkania enalia TaxID=147567 RepID=A0A9P4K9N6_9PLEO|nr:hypothetical protein CC78DRAFT_616558 [Didymosphaeria enalia]